MLVASFGVPSFCAACLNALLTSFVLISLFGLLRMVNSRFLGVRFVLIVRLFRYCLRYFTASLPIKSGGFLNLVVFILQGIGVSGSRILSRFPILSCFIVCGGSPDCLITVKKAFSLIGQHLVILLILSSSMSPFFIFLSSFGW